MSTSALPASDLPLAGVRILDLSAVIFGPLATQTLADYGADVIKIEPPEGDSTRFTGPDKEHGMSTVFLGANRNKRGVVLDLKLADDRAALLKLVDGADVFVHSMRPQKLVKLGIDPETLLARNPRLVYAGLHGFAEGGPYAGRPAYDDIVQGISGNAALMQRLTGAPAYYPTIAADKTCAQVAAHAILAALFKRERTGKGGFVEVPMFESMVAFNLVEHLYGEHFDPPISGTGTGYPRVMAAWRKPYQTSDGFVCAMPYTNAHWQRFFNETGHSQHAADARFANISERTKHIEPLYQITGDILRTRSSAAWLELFERLEIPAARVNQLEDLAHDPQLVAGGFFETLRDEKMGAVRFTGVPVKFDGVRPAVRMPPRLGEHNDEVLRAAGVLSGSQPRRG